MKQTLLFALFTSGLALAQNPIPALCGTLNPGEANQQYNVVTVAVTDNQAAAGMNMLWDFGTATPVIGKSYINISVPGELLTLFPGSALSSVGVETGDPDITDMLLLSNSNEVTGVVTDDYVLYYTGDTGSFGTFPLQYGDLSADIVSGTYFYDNYQGTFEGTLISEVDAYGTIAFGPNESAFVTRLRSLETLELSYPGFGVVGSFTQTTYRYYREGEKWPVFKATRTVITVPALSIFTDSWTSEKMDVVLASGHHDLVQVSVRPNPVTDKALVSGMGQNLSVTVTDITGKTVLTSQTHELDLTSLPAGVYLGRITGEGGTTVKKIVKQ